MQKLFRIHGLGDIAIWRRDLTASGDESPELLCDPRDDDNREVPETLTLFDESIDCHTRFLGHADVECDQIGGFVSISLMASFPSATCKVW